MCSQWSVPLQDQLDFASQNLGSCQTRCTASQKLGLRSSLLRETVVTVKISRQFEHQTSRHGQMEVRHLQVPRASGTRVLKRPGEGWSLEHREVKLTAGQLSVLQFKCELKLAHRQSNPQLTDPMVSRRIRRPDFTMPRVQKSTLHCRILRIALNMATIGCHDLRLLVTDLHEQSCEEDQMRCPMWAGRG